MSTIKNNHNYTIQNFFFFIAQESIDFQDRVRFVILEVGLKGE